MNVLTNILNSNIPYGRKAWIDDLKMFAMVCVLLCHLPGCPLPLNNFIVSFNMPLFMLLSGMMVYKGLKKINSFDTLFVFLEKLCLRLAIPSIVFSAVDQLIRGLLFSRMIWPIVGFVIIILYLATYFHKQKPTWYLYILRICSVLFIVMVDHNINYYWFLEVLFELQVFCAIVSYILNTGSKIDNDKVKFILLCFLVYVAAFFRGTRIFEMSSYFCFGIMISCFMILDRIKLMNNTKVIFVFLIGFICFWYSKGHNFYGMSVSELIANGYGIEYPMRQVCAFLFSVVLIYIFIKLNSNYSFISYLGSRSMPFYIIHALIIQYAMPFFLPSVSSNLPYWAVFLSVVCSVAFLTILTISLCEQTTITRRLLLGELK